MHRTEFRDAAREFPALTVSRSIGQNLVRFDLLQRAGKGMRIISFIRFGVFQILRQEGRHSSQAALGLQEALMGLPVDQVVD